MKLSALPYLCCIQCRSPLKIEDGYKLGTGAQSAEVISGRLVCSGCGKHFPVVKGVPRLVNEQVSSPTDIRTGRSFAIAWRQFPRMDERYRQQFFDWIFPVDADFLAGKIVLEGGCGKGRHAKIIAESGAKEVFAVDIGEAVDIAYGNVGHLPHIHIIQADIGNMPFGRIFDFVFSVGVLHHMEAPLKGFQSLCDKVNDDGAVCVWVYGRENNWWLIHIVNPIRVAITSRLPAALLKVISAVMALPVYVWSKFVAHCWRASRSLLPRLPVLFYEDYMAYIARFDYVEIHHIVFDHLVAPVANYVCGKDFRRWFKASGLPQAVIRWHNQNSWTGFASRHPEETALMQLKVDEQRSAAQAHALAVETDVLKALP